MCSCSTPSLVEGHSQEMAFIPWHFWPATGAAAGLASAARETHRSGKYRCWQGSSPGAPGPEPAVRDTPGHRHHLPPQLCTAASHISHFPPKQLVVTKYIYLKIITSRHFFLESTKTAPQSKSKSFGNPSTAYLVASHWSSLCSLWGERATKTGIPNRPQTSL